MKSRLYLLLGVLMVAAVGGLLWWLAWEPREPVYDGKPLGYWLGAYDRSSPPPGGLLTDSNAVPLLTRALKPNGWAEIKFYREVWPRLPSAVRAHLPLPTPTRYNAASLLGQMGAIAKPAIPALIHVLKTDEDVHARRHAALALGHFGKDDPNVVPALKAALKDQDYVAFGAACALWGLDPEIAINVLREHESAQVRCTAAWALGALGRAGKADARTVAALKEASLKDPDRAVRQRALLEVALIEPDNDAAVKMVVPLLTDKESAIKFYAARALGDLGVPSPAAIRALSEAVKDADWNVRYFAIDALGRIGDKTAVAAVTEALGDKDSTVRAAATNTLQRLDPEAAARAGVKPPSP